MNKPSTRRIAAAAAVVAMLVVFAAPAAASSGSFTLGSSWELPSILSWLDSLWSGLTGVPAQPAEDAGTSSPTAVHVELREFVDPDGVDAASTPPEDDGTVVGSSYGGSN